MCGGLGAGGGRGEGAAEVVVEAKNILFAQRLTVNSDAAPKYIYIFSLHRGPLSHL